MRKLYVLLVILLVGFLINFAIWFLHTQTITNAVNGIKAELLLNKYKLQYKNIKFTDFRSWAMNATLENVEIYDNNDEHGSKIALDQVSVLSNPYNQTIKVILPNDIKYAAKMSAGFKEVVFRFKEKLPFIQIKFNKKLSDIIDDTKFDVIKHLESLKVSIEQIEEYDSDSKQLILEIPSIDINIDNKLETLSDTHNIDLLMQLKGLQYNEHYSSDDEKKNNYVRKNHDLGLADITLDANVIVPQYSTMLGQKMFIKIKDITCQNDKFLVNVVGSLDNEQASMLPYYNIKFTVNNFTPFYQFYQQGYKSVAGDSSSKKKIGVSDKQVDEIVSLIKELGDQGDDKIVMDIRYDKTGAYVNDKNASYLLRRLSSIFIPALAG